MSRGRTPLRERYGPEDLRVFSQDEARRFLQPGDAAAPHPRAVIRWELLYRIEPELYHRLVSAEPLHPALLELLPDRVGHAVEVGAGTGRLTVELAPRSDRLLALEPAAGCREILVDRLRLSNHGNVTVAPGFFDALPVGSRSADLVIACSALTDDSGHGGDRGLLEMERICRPGGRVVVVWPTNPEWLRRRGYSYRCFEGRMEMEFRDLDEAVELTSIFYPEAADAVRRRGSSRVPHELLGNRPPSDMAWKDIPPE